MPLSKQPYGLTNFFTSVSKCPPNPDAIRAIVFQKDNLAVVDGATTEISVALSKFFTIVDNAAKLSFSLESAPSTAKPYTVYKLDLGGLDVDDEVKFIALLPTYGTGASSSQQYIEWTFLDSIDSGTLQNAVSVGPSATTSFDFFKVNQLEFSWGSYVSFTGNTGNGALWAATDGGLLKWTGSESVLWNTLNSNSYSDFISSISIDSSQFWVGSNNGIFNFSEETGFAHHKNVENSSILSNVVNDIEIVSSTVLAIGTDSGFSIYDHEMETWKNFTKYNTPSLNHNNIKKVKVNGEVAFLGTTGGVYVYDIGASSWGTTLNSSLSGWSVSDNVQDFAYYGTNLYVGTTGGLVVVPYTGGTAQVITSGGTGPTGPISNVFKSIRIVTYDNTDLLYAGHDNGFSVLGLTSNSWILKKNSSNFSSLSNSANDILPDYLSSQGLSSQSVFLAESTGNIGLSVYYQGQNILKNVPDENHVTNSLLTYPSNYNNTPLAPEIGTIGSQWETVYGDCKVDSHTLYSQQQPIYFVFSKDMTGGSTASVSFENFFSLKSGITGTGSTVSGSWTWDSSGKIGTFTPTALSKAQGYNMKVVEGATSSDGVFLKETFNVGFYTENIVPELGWRPLSKLLIHTGTDGNYTQGLYLRNPQASVINITALIGR